jgi:hypothetical protein
MVKGTHSVTKTGIRWPMEIDWQMEIGKEIPTQKERVRVILRPKD